VIEATQPAQGGTGTVESTLPIGGGLSSSASLEVALAIALGADTSDPVALARCCQRAEHVATGVPCGIMDQVASIAGVEGHALLLDCTTTTWTAVAMPAPFLVVHSGEARALAGSAYAQRRVEVEAAVATVGPLRNDPSLRDLDPLPRRRARHVITENQRVLAFVEAMRVHDLRAAGHVMSDSHASLRDDFEVSTPALDALVSRLTATKGVYGARLTGAGFGGCVVALMDPEMPAPDEGWVVHAAPGATTLPSTSPSPRSSSNVGGS
jgi:galactokinase